MKRKLKGCLSIITTNLFCLAGFAAEKPNVIFIMADDMGYGDLGCYGQNAIKTPNIDKLAKEGMRFTQAYAGSTVSAPSRCALMTGYHTGKAVIRNNGIIADGRRINLPDSTLTVAEIFKEQGYNTGIFGKWGLGEAGSEGIPGKQGFDEFYGYLDQGLAHKYYPTSAWHNTEKVDFPENANKKEVTNIAEWYFDGLKRFVKSSAKKPFFIYYATTLPHAEMRTTKADLSQYLDKNGKSLFDEVSFAGKSNYGPTDIPFATYAAMVSQLDRHVGELVKMLEELGLSENTIIVFTSDNGPHKEGGYDPAVFNGSGNLRGIKRDLYEGGIRVPFIVKWPGQIEAGSVSDYTWASWDLLPTVCDILHTKAPAGLDGISALPILKGEKYERPTPLYWEFITPTSKFRMAVRLGKWKGVVYDLEKEMELYDMEADPLEEENVAAQYPDKVRELKTAISETRIQSEYWPCDEKLLQDFYCGRFSVIQ